MSSTHYTSERLSFWQLIKKIKIEIPIIQRDYAQGREAEIRIRENFLRALKCALNGRSIELDFIYGSKSDDCLQPLDGQQRLTTLFLLHWYAATRENALENEIKSNLEKFTYEIRASSREFCINLVNNGIIIRDVDETISETIKDAHWFFLSWKSDPSINAMLIMLDAIHSIFQDLDDPWGKLTDKGNRPITFQYIELKHFGLSDDLYIKMNARGKQLTAFESFKASFEKKIAENKWDIGKSFTDTFSHKADRTWTDLFWTNNRDSFDQAYINFISISAINSIAVANNQQLQKKKREETIQNLFNKPENVCPDTFEEGDYIYLRKCLDIYSKTDQSELSFNIPFWKLLTKNSTLFSIIINRHPTYPQRVLFYAQTEYLLNVKNVNHEVFKNWMRVVRNIIQNSSIDSPESFIGAMNLIAELLGGCSDIYDFLSKESIKSSFASAQVNEEILKARLIIKNVFQNKNTSKIIFEAEDTNFCKGNISFLFYCVGYEGLKDDFDSKQLSNVISVIKQHLEGNDVSNEFRRGLLTIEDTEFYNYWWSWLHAVEATKRKLITNTNDLKSFSENPEFQHYLKKFINQLTINELCKLLREYTPPDDMPNWKKRLIQEPDLLDFSQLHYIAIKDDNSCCYLLPKTRVANSKDGKRKLKKIE